MMIFLKRALGIMLSSLVTITALVTAILPLSVDAAVHVNGYYRKDGTYVQPYYRSDPDSSPYNNWSYPGNTNPYTGVTAGGDPSSYLNNYYSGSSAYPSYNTTPSCPLFATYDSLSSTCKCNSGYIVSGSSCINANSYCYQTLGYGSHFDSSTNNCSCDAGYVIDSNGQCSSGSSVCRTKYGSYSSYNILKNTCSCNYGYTFSPGTNKCVSDDDWCTEQYGSGSEYSTLSAKCVCKDGYQVSTSGSSCERTSPKPLSSIVYSCSAFGEYAESLTGTDMCVCSSGYKWNSDRTKCIEAAPSNASTVTSVVSSCTNKKVFSDILNKCICPVGYTEDASDGCITKNAACQLRLGPSFYSQDEGNCYCDTGYDYDQNTDKCIAKKQAFSGKPKSAAQLLTCEVAANTAKKKYFKKGDRLIRSIPIKSALCFTTEAMAVKGGYKK